MHTRRLGGRNTLSPNVRRQCFGQYGEFKGIVDLEADGGERGQTSSRPFHGGPRSRESYRPMIGRERVQMIALDERVQLTAQRDWSHTRPECSYLHAKLWLRPRCVGQGHTAPAPSCRHHRCHQSADVCFTPESGHVQCNSVCPLCANSGHCSSYSITSSAAFSKPNGTARPSVLAVFKLMTKSNLVGCKSGRSAGFSPLRIRPV